MIESTLTDQNRPVEPPPMNYYLTSTSFKAIRMDTRGIYLQEFMKWFLAGEKFWGTMSASVWPIFRYPYLIYEFSKVQFYELKFLASRIIRNSHMSRCLALKMLKSLWAFINSPRERAFAILIYLLHRNFQVSSKQRGPEKVIKSSPSKPMTNATSIQKSLIQGFIS